MNRSYQRERFMSCVSVTPDGHWLWNERRDFRSDPITPNPARPGELLAAHVLAFDLFREANTGGGGFIRACDEPLCVRPDSSHWRRRSPSKPPRIVTETQPSRGPQREFTECSRKHPQDAQHSGQRRNGRRYCRTCAAAARRTWRSRQNEKGEAE